MQLVGDLKTAFDQITTLIEKELPERGKDLSDNVTNLEKVAQYCEDIYVNSKEGDKQHLLNGTRDYTAQALASVAYQINVLASNFLQLLDSQSVVINDMAVSMSHLAHDVKIHKEKVARREIGILTTNKSITRTVKVKRPENDEKSVKYVRKPIDYSSLDDVGHGVKLSRMSSNLDPLTKIGVGRQNSYSSTHSSSGISCQNQNDMATPPLMLKASTLMSVNSGNGLGTVRSTVSTGSSYHYRTPVVPPSVPSEYLSRQELGIYSSKKELNQSLGADSLSGAYGAANMSNTSGYRRPSQTGTNSSNITYNNSSEYSDTMDRRMANNYLQQHQYNFSPSSSMNQGYSAMINSSMNNNSSSSVGYASGKEIGIIRTNLNNIDYAANGTLYRRPQLHPSIYERSNSGGNTGAAPNIPTAHMVFNRNDSNQRMPPQNLNSSGHGLPPPPPPNIFASSATAIVPPMIHNQGGDHLENQVFGPGYIDNQSDDDDDIIPNWVPLDRCIEKVITIYDYEGLRDDELSFKENMHIYVIKKNDDDWYEGIMKNKNGDIVQGRLDFMILLNLY